MLASEGLKPLECDILLSLTPPNLSLIWGLEASPRTRSLSLIKSLWKAIMDSSPVLPAPLLTWIEGDQPKKWCIDIVSLLWHQMITNICAPSYPSVSICLFCWGQFQRNSSRINNCNANVALALSPNLRFRNVGVFANHIIICNPQPYFSTVLSNCISQRYLQLLSLACRPRLISELRCATRRSRAGAGRAQTQGCWD